MTIVWEEPPEDANFGQRKGQYVDLLVACKERVGTWARVPGERTESTAAALAQNVRRGKVKGFEPGHWESAAKGTAVWVRYLGPPEPEPESGSESGVQQSDVEMEAHRSLTPRVRAWASSNGFTVTDRGRIGKDVFDAYFKATGEKDPRPRVV